MDIQALVEHLEAAGDFLRQEQPELALTHLLDVYEAGHFTDELGALLRRVGDDLLSIPEDSGRVIDDLISRARGSQQEESLEQGFSFSDFFEDATPVEGEVEEIEDVDELNLDDHFSFADEGGEISFGALEGEGDLIEIDEVSDDEFERMMEVDDEVTESPSPQPHSLPTPPSNPFAHLSSSSPAGGGGAAQGFAVEEVEELEGDDALDNFFEEAEGEEQAHWFATSGPEPEPLVEVDVTVDDDFDDVPEIEVVAVEDEYKRSGVRGESITSDEARAFHEPERKVELSAELDEPPPSVQVSPEVISGSSKVQVSPDLMAPEPAGPAPDPADSGAPAAPDVQPDEVQIDLEEDAPDMLDDFDDLIESDSPALQPQAPTNPFAQRTREPEAVAPPETHEPEPEFDLDFDFDGESEPEAVAPPETHEPEPSFDLDFDFDGEPEPEVVAPPETHEPEPSFDLDFDFDDEDADEDGGEPEPAPVAPPETHEPEPEFELSFDFEDEDVDAGEDEPEAVAPPETHEPEPSFDLDFDDEGEDELELEPVAPPETHDADGVEEPALDQFPISEFDLDLEEGSPETLHDPDRSREALKALKEHEEEEDFDLGLEDDFFDGFDFGDGLEDAQPAEREAVAPPETHEPEPEFDLDFDGDDVDEDSGEPEPAPVAPPETHEPEPSFDLDFDFEDEDVDAGEDEPEAVAPPETHEPEPSFDLDFDFDDEDVDAGEPEPAPVAPPETHEPEPEFELSFDFDDDEPEAVAPPETHEPEPSFDLDFDFDDEDVDAGEDEPEAVAPPETHEPEPSFELSFDFDDDEEPEVRPGLSGSSFADPSSREPTVVGQDANVMQQLIESSRAEPLMEDMANVDPHERETRANPALPRDLVARDRAERQEESADIFASDDDWGVGDDWSLEADQGMPGLSDDWFDAPKESPREQAPSDDIHSNATAIPGLTGGNSNHPFSGMSGASRASERTSSQRSDENVRRTTEAPSVPPQDVRRTAEAPSVPPQDVRATSEAPALKSSEDLRRTSEAPSVPPSGTRPLEPQAEEDDFDFDLGFSGPDIEEPGSRGGFDEREQTPAGGAEFDMFDQLSGPSAGVKGTMFGMPVNLERPKKSASLEEQTPSPLEERVTEDEFFALAESIASEQSLPIEDEPEPEPLRPYRGEPVIRRDATPPRFSREPTPPRFTREPSVRPTSQSRENPFAHEAPTGVRKALVEDSAQSSFVLEEIESDPAPTPVELAREQIDEGALDEAMRILKAHLAEDGGDDEARAMLGEIEDGLEDFYLNRLGALSQTPVISIPMSQLAGMSLDHRSGFLISQIDGMMTFEDILDLSAMPRLETLEVLVDLLDQDVIVAA